MNQSTQSNAMLFPLGDLVATPGALTHHLAIFSHAATKFAGSLAQCNPLLPRGMSPLH